MEVHYNLQPDPNAETAALLRDPLQKFENVTLGTKVRIIPQWTGRSPSIVRVQSLPFASLAASIFAPFHAILGKQWLNKS